MHCTTKLTEDLYYVGAGDRRLALFENAYPIPDGVSYNAYLLLDEKTVLLDTVDRAVSGRLLENLDWLLQGRALDYLVINHMEPDHCAAVGLLLERWPALELWGTPMTLTLLRQFFGFSADDRFHAVQEGDTLCTGQHTLRFFMAPMVHWPETMVTYDETDKTLFSADAFGTFGALSGNLFADEIGFDNARMAEARRYYTNIVGKYGPQVQNLLKKAAGLDIAMLCPLHGPLWREQLDTLVGKYQLWSTYTPEEKAPVIFYASVYGDTENAAELLASRLAERGIKHIAMYDVSVTHVSRLVAEAFRCSHLLFAATTYNAGIFPAMEHLLRELQAHNLQNRVAAIVENGSWAPTAGNLIRKQLESMRGMTVLADTVTLKSSVQDAQHAALLALADQVAEDLAT